MYVSQMLMRRKVLLGNSFFLRGLESVIPVVSLRKP